jgi:hypothetical protein
MKHFPFFIATFIFTMIPAIAEEIPFKIDTDFPGGNIKILGIDGETIR